MDDGASMDDKVITYSCGDDAVADAESIET